MTSFFFPPPASLLFFFFLPASRRRFSSADFLAAVTADEDVDWGGPVGGVEARNSQR